MFVFDFIFFIYKKARKDTTFFLYMQARANIFKKKHIYMQFFDF